MAQHFVLAVATFDRTFVALGEGAQIVARVACAACAYVHHGCARPTRDDLVRAVWCAARRRVVRANRSRAKTASRAARGAGHQRRFAGDVVRVVAAFFAEHQTAVTVARRFQKPLRADAAKRVSRSTEFAAGTHDADERR